MASETKKRLLLSKWRTQYDDMAHARVQAAEDKDEIEELRGQIAARDSVQDATLLDVKYWIMNSLVHHRPVSDPRVILRKVEEAIG